MECNVINEDVIGERLPFFVDTEQDLELVADELSEEAEEVLCDDVEEIAPEMEGCNDVIKLYLLEVRRTKLLSAEEERELARKIALGDKSAREKMILANLRLVVSISKRYMNRGLPFADLIEEGNLGLMKAVDRFRVEKECRFSTYATWWIRQAVERALVNQSRTVRLPVHIAEEVSRMNRVATALRVKLKREPSIREIAAELSCDEGNVRKLMVYMRKAYSLDVPRGEDTDQSLMETLEDTSTASPATLSEDASSFRAVADLLETFSETERTVLRLRFGLNDEEPQTLDTIGQRFGVTRERIRQIEAKALQKLRSLIDAPRQPMACSCN
ncbi:sigma-70 family RNA polymerase sigma factor [Geomonas sp. RF6]|uniref:sigma-70 family RNA polymerase sigma factor n=1 Tax=Geomonas sp. RF6 TaxID=2897342 RepID=UPI001E487F55|nr:sigma-70 family RNA polymerase sigma factor [Geomonas sp. RF6]UFS70097.1 sigma-70 family RNA polymerase sigma factor [Geomonas sp. RF6]